MPLVSDASDVAFIRLINERNAQDLEESAVKLFRLFICVKAYGEAWHLLAKLDLSSIV